MQISSNKKSQYSIPLNIPQMFSDVRISPSQSDAKTSSNSENTLKKAKSLKTQICDICAKSYSCYPALYTHKRNKHNIIPVTGKPLIFKNVLKQKKFKYKTILTDKKNSTNVLDALSIYEEILLSLHRDPNCILYDPFLKVENHTALKKLKELAYLNRNETNEIIKNAKIDEAISIYIIYFAEVDSNMELVRLNLLFCVLLRIYLNTTGWDHIRKYVSSNMSVNYTYSGSFTEVVDCTFIPDLINTFISVFIKLDKKFHIDEKKLNELAFNFCNWLFINNLTNYKVIYNQ